MEFVNRKACVEHYQEQFPNLPKYMIEMALDYDLSNGGQSNEKPLTGSQKRKQKKVKKNLVKRDTSVQDMIESAVKSGKPVEIDCAQVVQDYKMAPLVKGYVSTEGILNQMTIPEEALTEGEVDDFLIHRDEESLAE